MTISMRTGLDPYSMGNGAMQTNEMRQMRMQNMLMRYGYGGGGNNPQPDTNATYQDIPGMTPEDSQIIGKMAASLGSSGNNQYMIPVNQPAQVLLNNKSLMGGAADFASGLAQSLKNPAQPSQGAASLPKNLETTLAAYQNNDTTKAASRVQQMYNEAKNLYSKGSPSSEDDNNLTLLGAKITNPQSRMTDLPADPNTVLNFFTSMGIGAAQAKEIEEGKSKLTPELRQKVMQAMTSVAQGVQDTANTARGAYTHYMTLNGVQPEDIDKMFPSFGIQPVATENYYMMQNAISKGADAKKAQDAIDVMNDTNATPANRAGAQHYLKMYQ